MRPEPVAKTQAPCSDFCPFICTPTSNLSGFLCAESRASAASPLGLSKLTCLSTPLILHCGIRNHRTPGKYTRTSLPLGTTVSERANSQGGLQQLARTIVLCTLCWEWRCHWCASLNGDYVKIGVVTKNYEQQIPGFQTNLMVPGQELLLSWKESRLIL